MLVSIVVPTFNRSNLLRKTLQSVVAQSYSDWEVLVIDDGSTEPVEDVVKSLSDERIIYHRQMNQGVSVARNLGIQLARGEYIAFLDSDDLMAHEYLAEKVGLARAEPEAGVIGGGCRYVDFDGESVLKETPARPLITYEDLAIWTAFPGCTANLFAKRALLLTVGGFRTNLIESEDRDILRRMVEIEPVVSVDKITAIVRVHASPRINRDLSSLKYCRRWVTKQVQGKKLKKRSSAWNEYVFGIRSWQSGARLSAIYHWAASFVYSPVKVHPELKRLRSIFRAVFGR